MNKLITILLLSVVSLPIMWNGLGFIHYLTEHTHTFCSDNKDDHQHSSDDCLTICHLFQHQDQNHNQISNKVEFYELKNYIKTDLSMDIQFVYSNHNITNNNLSHHFGRSHLNDVFHPPIS